MPGVSGLGLAVSGQSPDCFDDCGGVAFILPGDVMSAAMSDGGEQNRTADGQTGGSPWCQKLGWDVSLVVQHDDEGVDISAA